MLTNLLIKGFVMPVDTQAATDRLMRFLAVEGVTGKEAAIGRELAADHVHDPHGHRAAVRRSETEARRPEDRQFSEDRAWRRQPRRLRRSRHAGRRACEAEA